MDIDSSSLVKEHGFTRRGQNDITYLEYSGVEVFVPVDGQGRDLG